MQITALTVSLLYKFFWCTSTSTDKTHVYSAGILVGTCPCM